MVSEFAYASVVGFTAYIGMLEVEYAHNHPAMRVFCHLLTDKCIKPPVFKRCKESDEGASNPDNTRPLPRNQSTSHQPHDKGDTSVSYMLIHSKGRRQNS